MEHTYHIRPKRSVTCSDYISLRQFLRLVLNTPPDAEIPNMDILTVYDSLRTKVIDAPFASLRELYLSTRDLILCYHVPGALILAEEQPNGYISRSSAWQNIPEAISIPLYLGGKFRYAYVSGYCTLGNFVAFLQRRGFLPADVTSMTVHECFCFESIPSKTLDLRPGSAAAETPLGKLELRGGPPIYCDFT